jgi:hypothetical protein
VASREEITGALESAGQRIAERDRLRAQLEVARAARDEAARAAEATATDYTAEQADVARLEGFSPSRIWASLTFSREGDLARERAERDRASYVAAEAHARLTRLDGEVVRLEQRLAAYAKAEVELAAAVAAKEAWLAETGDPAGVELVALSAETADLRSRQKELHEAAVAAVDARRALADAERLLGSARNWSNWDTFMGGGLFSDMVKYDRVDQSTRALADARRALETLQRELADVGTQAALRLEASMGLKVFDTLFDNIFSDLAMRSRIVEAHNSVAGLLPRVVALLPPLDEELRVVEARLAAIATRRTALVEST